ncbi:MAG TPA: hypothetical protein VHC47_14820 [Mucilaginibacter sp.]|nr:hypothetical protein [Mucilaginibacter sp.]
MSRKLFYAYLAGGILAIILLIYQLAAEHESIDQTLILLNGMLALALFYMAYKVRREKDDKDLM